MWGHLVCMEPWVHGAMGPLEHEIEAYTPRLPESLEASISRVTYYAILLCFVT